MLTYIIPFIILILVVVFIHEYGHYYFAKKYGVGITDFSIGFGKEIFGWNDKSGTRWKICWIPLGGYVKFFGDRNVFSQADHEKILKQYNEEDQEKLFVIKPLYQRALIVFGGPLANFLLAIAIFFCIYTFVGKDFTPAIINEVQKDSPAMIGGLQDNDVILEIDGNKVESIMDVSKYITTSTGDATSCFLFILAPVVLVNIQLKNYEKAIESYEKAKELYPSMRSPDIMIKQIKDLIKKQSI